jgi:hypothetical protein
MGREKLLLPSIAFNNLLSHPTLYWFFHIFMLKTNKQSYDTSWNALVLADIATSTWDFVTLR